MKKLKPKVFRCETWKMKYLFFIGWSKKDFALYMAKEFRYHDTDLDYADGATFYCTSGGNTITCIWTKKKRDYSVIAHECAHAANRTMHLSGWTMDYLNSEPYCYLLEAIMRKALEK